MFIIRCWLFSLLLINSGIVAQAQMPDYHLQQFDYSFGIRPGGIIGMSKDSRGFLWILYPRGVQRFDGSRVMEYKPGNDLGHLFCDESGRLWVNSNKNVFYFNETRQEFQEVPVESESTGYGTVFSLPGNQVLLASRDGFYLLDSIKNKFVPTLRSIPVAPPYDIRSFASYGNALFFTRGKNLYRYNIRSKRIDSIPNAGARAIYPINEDSAAVSAWNLGSYWYNFAKRRSSVISIPENREPNGNYGLKNFGIRDFTKVADHKFMLASTHGLFQYDEESGDFEPLEMFEKGRQIRTSDMTNMLYADKENYVWMTYSDGIARFPIHGRSFGLVRLNRSDMKLPPSIDNIRGITGDGKDNFWLATGNGFVNWDKTRNRVYIYLAHEGSTEGLAYPSVRGIAYDGKYVILGPSNLGMWLFDPLEKKYRRPVYDSIVTKSLSEQDFIDGITTLQNGDHIITGRDAIYILDGKTYVLRRLQSPADKENSNFCYQTTDGHVWITTQRGLHLFDKQLNYIQKVTLPSSRQYISAGCSTTDNLFLFSLDNGLYTASYGDGKVNILKKSSVFDKIFIASLSQDEDGFIWASSDYGIYRYDTLNKSLNLFDYTDNIQGYGFNLNSVYKNNEGTLFLGGMNGLNYLNPQKLPYARDNFKVYISGIKLFNDQMVYDISKEKIFPYHQRSFEVSFMAPYFNNAGKVEYRYRLEGFDKEWKELGNNNQLRFTSLPPGKYLLEVQASINKTDWINATNNFSFVIRPPFWFTWWFIGLCILALAAGIRLIMKNRDRQLREKQEEIEVEQSINYFSSSMYSQQSVDQLLWDVAKNCIGRLHFEDCVIYIMDEQKNELVQRAAYGKKSPEAFQLLDPISIPLGKGITGTVAKTGKAIIVNNTFEEPRYIVDGKRGLSEIAVPIITDGKVFGVIDCEHSKKAFFTQKHLNILQTIASLCAGKIIKMKAEAGKMAAEQVLMDTKQKMQDIEMQALRAQMNPHFIFNCLNSINRYIIKSDQATASLYLTRFAKLIRLILDNSNNQSVTLSNEVEALQLYIEMESIRFEKQFTYGIVVDKALQPDSIFVPPLIIQPYVENSIWHGLLHKEDSGHLDIHLSLLENKVLLCVIEDNGVGRKKANELKSKSVSSKKSLGMKLTEDRLALLNKQAQLDSSVLIEDLLDENGEGCGTRVIIQIPID